MSRAGMNREALRWGLGAFALLRLITLAASWHATANLTPGPLITVPGYEAPVSSGLTEDVAGPWLRADALWYLKIATQGYSPDDGTLAFFPAFPAVIWALDKVMGNEAIAGLLAANLATMVGLVMLFAFVDHALDARAARTAVVGFALFPTAFFLVAPYGEAMLLFFGAGALLAAQKGKVGLSFAAGIAAALSRPFGAAIALPLAAIISARKRGRARWAAPAGPVIGLALWMTYAWRLTGDPLALVNIQGNWQREPMFAGRTLAAGFAAARQYAGIELGGYFVFDLAATLFGLALIPAVLIAQRGRRKPGIWLGIGLAAYGVVTLAIPLSLPFMPRPLMSAPRFVLALFPLFMGLVILPGKIRIVLAAALAAGLFVGAAVFLANRPLF